MSYMFDNARYFAVAPSSTSICVGTRGQINDLI